ncbi:MAG: ABC transporter ATP-binding protein [Actinomycetia bacterium]|nr:ABC transporter ATP-binding protein [Actinomycetes bacterium]
MSAPATALQVTDLSVDIVSRKQRTEILRGVSVELPEGTMRGLVGETGSGKTMTARAVMGLLPPGGTITSGSITLGVQELIGLDNEQLNELRGPVMSMVFQNPRTALYPMHTVERQLGSIIEAHQDLRKAARRARAREYLALAGIPDPDRVARAYPHELSGGMAQRVVIAAALINEPAILIADEPTTGLDATVQRQILELLASLQSDLSLSVLMITHDLGIVAQYCDSLSVMHEGQVVEAGEKRQVLRQPAEPYTQQLIAASELSEVGHAKQAGSA